MTSFLSDMVARQSAGFSISGKIRAGIKVPTKRTLDNPSAMEIVARVKKGEISFQNAQAEILKKTGLKNPFYPRNSRCFFAHPWDMESGKIASDQLLKLYGQVRDGDPEPRLYRFPVVFADIHRGGIDAALGSGLAVRGGGAQTIHYQSRYGDDGVRRCVYLPPVVPSKDASRKQFSRREFVVRGVCDTDLCPQFASGECRFAGTLRFYIPGMPGAGLYCLETGSTQAASEIYLRLSSLLDECGYLPNFIPDGRPVFWLTKALKNRVYYDEEGNQKKGEQWVPVLETEIDLTKVKMLREHKRMLLAAPSAQPAVSGLPAAWVMPDPQEAGAGHCAAESACQVDNDGVVLEGAPEQVTASDASDAWLVATAAADAGATTGAATEASATGASHGVAVDLLAKARDMGIEHKVTEWAALRYGAQWDKELAGTALEGFRAIHSRFGQHTGSFLDLQIRLLANDIPFQKVALPYFKAKFGGIGLGANLAAIIAHLDELLDQGPSVARSFMQANGV
ncbi:recombination directionality factor [Verminephrobacter eiseniae]|uniref:Uncharacterized protein n=1 Tax=Verminephrobacter eiseniae (strain EF01-2) TaxID=391735 RepID=A1WP40_VEREI|nr:hypothetical protein [Verminephrobacter eiseniae]ABM59397.1 hypothetical protein Veis_3681 [Verminephrobacter eiseniae EF01-2]MCW5284923.1 hypothetical protein [Verminephrobacter eiseniae]MCW5302631.1 hypothetical protein [Verminephrobacter eiseniae]